LSAEFSFSLSDLRYRNDLREMASAWAADHRQLRVDKLLWPPRTPIRRACRRRVARRRGWLAVHREDNFDFLGCQRNILSPFLWR